ncbi:MAG TPA: AMP-binding protein [Nitrososphaera sp.]|nr:AMP-binding protein [Nitrososphaera sp.]
MEEREPFAFQPSASHLADSNMARFMKKHGISGYKELVKRANSDISWYWDAVNSDLDLEWFRKYDRVYDDAPFGTGGIPWTKWFIGGKCNIVANAIDRHARQRPDKVAYVFANEHGARKITYGELDLEVGRLASALLDAGVKKGDVVGIYLPMIPEAFYAIFACSKIGAVHATVFSGFSAPALRSRLVDSGARLLITANSSKRRGKDVDLKAQWSQAIAEGTKVEKVVVVADAGNGKGDHNNDYNNNKNSGTVVVNYGDFVNGKGQAKTEVMDAEDPLFVLYTSGTTGRPKGTLQVHGGFMSVAAQQAAYLIDLKPDDTLFWYADIGWITGQVWVVYGSPIVGATALVYEETLDYPAPDIWCKLIERHRVSIFGAAPTAIRLFMKNNVDTSVHDLSSLRMLACTGETINKEAWEWYFERVGKKKCPVINLSGGTEVGGAILSALPVMPLRPCTVGCPIPGFDADVLDESGRPASEGLLVIKKPWPSMSRGILNDPARFIETYWSRYGKSIWYHGDFVSVDCDGLWYMRGRADDVIKVAGHRIGTAEVEAAVMSHPAVAEAVAVGRPDDLKGEVIVLCVVIRDNRDSSSHSLSNDEEEELLKEEIARKVEEEIGRFARPEEVKLVPELPKTRTGKLVRRLVRAKVAGESISGQDASTVENPYCLDFL